MVTASTGQAIERVTYYHNDALGSPVAATDAGGTLLWREEYQPYGSRIKREAGSKDTAWYTGKQEESATGLSYFGARWYDPALGRFMAMDPAGFSPEHVASFRKYAYANNNPYVYVDPDGKESREALFEFLGMDDPSAGVANAAAAVAQGASGFADAVDAQVTDPINYVPLGALGVVKNVSKGLTTPGKYFGSKPKQDVKDALEKKYGLPKSSREHADTYYNEKTKRSYNVHEEPGHNDGKPHVDIRRRGGYEERKYDLKEGN